MNYFGTDGIRGTYGSHLTDELAYKLGRALAMDTPQAVILLARDTRLSGPALLDALILGIYSGGGSAINLGILPTNAVSHFVRKLGGDYGVMISASHNPPMDNGLKVFDKYGVKLCLAKQQQLSDTMSAIVETQQGHIYEPVFHSIDKIYCEDLQQCIPVNFAGMKVALDCCYGASYNVAKQLFVNCGAKVTVYNNRAKGELINVNCGATYTDYLVGTMQDNKCQLGFSFDGDCDRVAVLEGDVVLDNNAIFLAIARYLSEKGKVNDNTVVGTVLTNTGLELALQQYGIKLIRSDVGDSNIALLMQEKSLNVGGEQSGHYILSDYAVTSDALAVALLVSKIYLEEGSIIEYTKAYKPVESCHVNIDANKVDSTFLTKEALAELANKIVSQHDGNRIVLRPSGTEKKIRCYVEGEDSEKLAQLVASTIANI